MRTHFTRKLDLGMLMLCQFVMTFILWYGKGQEKLAETDKANSTLA